MAIGNVLKREWALLRNLPELDKALQQSWPRRIVFFALNVVVWGSIVEATRIKGPNGVSTWNLMRGHYRRPDQKDRPPVYPRDEDGNLILPKLDEQIKREMLRNLDK